jgi:hypothetical protein
MGSHKIHIFLELAEVLTNKYVDKPCQSVKAWWRSGRSLTRCQGVKHLYGKWWDELDQHYEALMEAEEP